MGDEVLVAVVDRLLLSKSYLYHIRVLKCCFNIITNSDTITTFTDK